MVKYGVFVGGAPHGAPFISCRLIFFDDIGSFSRCLRVLMSLGGVLKWAKTSILRCFRGILNICLYCGICQGRFTTSVRVK